MKLTVQSTLQLLIPLIFFHSTSASRFHKIIDYHRSAQDKAFHKALLKQLTQLKNHDSAISNPPSTIGSGVSLADLTLDAVVLPTDNTNSTYAAGSASTFQIYTSDMLPTSPAPSAACSSALTATVNCNSTVPLMRYLPYSYYLPEMTC